MAQQGLPREHLNKCGHGPCRCMIPPAQHFCSDACAQASGAKISGTLPGERHAGSCACGHSECTQARH
jgi:hypothetical protein